MNNNGNRFLRPAADAPRLRYQGQGTHRPPVTEIRLPERVAVTTSEGGDIWLEVDDGQSVARFRVWLTETRAADLESDLHFARTDEDAEGIAVEVEG
jgi:hypothetical protein